MADDNHQNDLVEKGKAIRGFIAGYRQKREDIDKAIAKLERTAILYEHGIDPATIASHRAHSIRGLVECTLKDGTIVDLPVDAFPPLPR